MKRSILTVGLVALSANAWAVCPPGTMEGQDPSSCMLQGTYTTDLVLTRDHLWLLSGNVFIGGDNKDSATLTIEKGTTVMGDTGRDAIVVSRGSKIEAVGTAEEPIVFTGRKQVRGSWGGLILNGNAPINGCSAGVCEAEGEGSTGMYGGADPDDSSGILQFVRVEYAGFQITPENEYNGIAFQGVGAGTIVQNVETYMTADDGVEFFGGTVNIRNVVVVGAADDSLDWVNGWVGKAQYVLLIQLPDAGNHGIEADNLDKNNDALPRSNPEFSNLTILATQGEQGAECGNGILLRRGTGAKFYNSVVGNSKKGCLRINDKRTFENGGTPKDPTDLQMKHVTFFGCTPFDEKSEDPWRISDWFYAQEGNTVADPLLKGYLPSTGSPLLTGGTYVPDDLFFDAVDFSGAVRDRENDWTKGWTVGLLQS